MKKFDPKKIPATFEEAAATIVTLWNSMNHDADRDGVPKIFDLRLALFIDSVGDIQRFGALMESMVQKYKRTVPRQPSTPVPVGGGNCVPSPRICHYPPGTESLRRGARDLGRTDGARSKDAW